MPAFEILLVTPDDHELSDFKRFIEAQGCLVLTHPLGEKIVPPDPTKFGVVVVATKDHQTTISYLRTVVGETRYFNIPLVVMASSDIDMETRKAFLTAGASEVLPGNAKPDKILGILQNCAENQPVVQALRDNLLQPFDAAMKLTFQEMLDLELRPYPPYQKGSSKVFGDISAVIGLMTKAEGSMVLSFPFEAARAVVERSFGAQMGLDASELDDDMVDDGIGEIANVVAGQARGLLHGSAYHFQMSTPTIISGSGHEVRNKQGIPSYVLPYGSSVGDFALQLTLAGV